MKKALIVTWEKYQDHEVIYPYYRVLEEKENPITVTNLQIDNYMYENNWS